MAQRAFVDYARRYAHIEDPTEARDLVLEAIDTAPLGWAQVRAVIVAGTGFLTDSYDLFAISLVSDMLGIVYYKGSLPQGHDMLIKVAAQAGALVGQLGFGWLADRTGRKKVYGVELGLISLATLGQCLSASSSSGTVSIIGLIVFWRVLLGIGVGGDYPISSVIVSEFAGTRWRGGMIASVFAMQGVGQLFASLVALIATAAFKNIIYTSDNTCIAVTSNAYGQEYKCEPTADALSAVDRLWRIIIGVGVLPALLALYFRLTIPETPRYTFDVKREVEKASADTFAWMQDEINARHSYGSIPAARRERDYELRHTEAGGLNTTIVPVASLTDFLSYFSRWHNARILIGTTISWFLLDIAYYSFQLNIPIIIQKISIAGWLPPSTERFLFYRLLLHNALGNLLLVCAGAIPGYTLAILTVDRIGRKWIQIQGFAMLTVLLIIRGFGKINNAESLLGLYICCQFFFNFGPNSTTFIVPGESFPTRYRATCHGLSAASGKLGAVSAQLILYALRKSGKVSDDEWLDRVMRMMALFTLLGTAISFLLVETKRRTLEDLANETRGEPHSEAELTVTGAKNNLA